MEQPPPVSPRPSAFGSTLKTNLDGFITSAVLNTPAPSTPTKEPLSLGVTSTNFRRFVQKSGPLFLAQDAVVDVLSWADPAKTMLFGAFWALLCLYPRLLIVLPNVVLGAVLLTTYGARVEPVKSTGEGKAYILSAIPPVEGSVDYLANLQNIQIVMGNVVTLSDAGRLLVPYLTWVDEPTTTILFQLTCISGLLLFFVAPYIPWSFVFLAAGEAVLVAGHPMVQYLIREASPIVGGLVEKYAPSISQVLRDDALSDAELDGTLEIVERFENSVRVGEGIWGVEEERGSVGEGRRWVEREDWEVDLKGDWAGGMVDADGYAYLGIDGSKYKSPLGSGTQSRRRRLTRRAVKFSTA